MKEFKQQEFLIKNITCNYINNQCNQYSSIRRNLYKSKNKAELNYYFNFDKNILEENDLMSKTAQIDSNSFNKQRILMLRDIDFYSIGFDLNLNFLKKEINSNFKTNLFILNSLDDANSISKFLFGLNLIVTNQTESGQFIFELFTAKQSIQSGVLKIDELINVNLTFTFNSIDLRINNSSQELMKLTDKTTSLFYRSLLKAYASFQLSLVSNLLNDQPDEYNNRPEAEMSACFSHFYLVTRKINNKLRKYDLIDQVKSISSKQLNARLMQPLTTQNIKSIDSLLLQLEGVDNDIKVVSDKGLAIGAHQLKINKTLNQKHQKQLLGLIKQNIPNLDYVEFDAAVYPN